MRIVAVAVAGCLVLGACGAQQVEDSAEYVSLLDDNAALAADLEQLESAVDRTDTELESVNAELAEQAVATEALRSDFTELLSLIFASQGGFDEQQSACIGADVVEDPEVRQAYLVLLASTDPASSEAKSALVELNGVLEGCGIDVPDPDEAAAETASADLPAAMEDVIRPVEVTGVALPLLPATDPPADPAVGMAAPVLVGEGYGGEPIRFDASESGPTMVVFLAHWCPHCNAEMPRLQQLSEEGRIPAGVDLVAVSSGVNPGAPNFPPDAWLEDMDWRFPTLADGIDLERQVFIAGNAFGVSGFPFVTLIDADGIVLARWAGERTADEIAALLAEQFDGS
jgi:thiol-disulfide isomerase/thioredoxin